MKKVKPLKFLLTQSSCEIASVNHIQYILLKKKDTSNFKYYLSQKKVHIQYDDLPINSYVIF